MEHCRVQDSKVCVYIIWDNMPISHGRGSFIGLRTNGHRPPVLCIPFPRQILFDAIDHDNSGSVELILGRQIRGCLQDFGNYLSTISISLSYV